MSAETPTKAPAKRAATAKKKEPQAPVPQDPEAELNRLDPFDEEVEWIIGKPESEGGEPDQWSRYVQRPLGYINKFRFFALLAGAIGKALESGSTIDDLLSEAGIARSQARFSLDNLRDMESAMPIVLRLVEASPDFLDKLHILLLDVPSLERKWFKEVTNQPHIPKSDKWGLSDDQGVKIIEVAIDQNYEHIKEFFTGKLPQVIERVRSKAEAESNSAQEEADHESASDQ